MKAAFSLAVASLYIAGALGQALQINTPASLVQCEPVLLSWTNGQAPYFLTVFPDGQPGTTLDDLGQQNGNSFTWTVNIAAGQSVGFQVRDSTGALGQSAAVPIQSSSDSSCVGQSSSGSSTSAASTSAGSSGSSGSSTSAASTSASVTGASTSHASSTAPASSSHSTSASGSNSGSAAASTTSSNAAPANVAQIGAAGVIGAAVIALLA